MAFSRNQAERKLEGLEKLWTIRIQARISKDNDFIIDDLAYKYNFPAEAGQFAFCGSKEEFPKCEAYLKFDN